MNINLSKRVQSIKPSPTLVITARAAELRARGEDIISFGTGEPDFDTPEHIQAAAVEALRKGQTKYTPVDGIPELKNAIVDKFKRENNVDYNHRQVIVSCGAKHSLYNLLQAVLDPDDEIIIPAPYWVSYPDMAKLSGARPVIIKTTIDENFKASPEKLRGAISSKARMLILNSPSNPSGASYDRDELLALGEVLLEHPRILIVTDDIYEHILWGQDKFVNIVNACPELYDRTIIVNGVSKAYSMTGWRIGYAGGHEDIIGGMKKIQSQSTSNPCSIAQAAAVAALNGDQTYIRESTAVFKERHDFIMHALREVDNITCLPSQGTFYSFPDMSKLIEKREDIGNDIELADFFLKKAGVAMVPGSAFGMPGYMRISFATSMEKLEQGMAQIKRALKE